jgi:ABC-2 type transport system permease protein
MYWTHVAQKDFADAVRSKMFWALSGLMILFATIGLYIPEAAGSDATVSDGIGALSGVMALFIPIVAIVVGYMSIVGERETGSVRMLLGLPLKRWEVLVGKLVGRAAVMIVPVLIGFAVAVPFALAVYGELPGTEYAEFVTAVVLVGATFVAIAVGISGSVNSRGKALALVVGLYAMLQFFWSLIPLGLYYLANGGLPEDSAPTWVEALNQVPPARAARNASEGLWNGISTSEPLVLQEWFSALLLLVWIGVPLLIGYLRFERADIS